MLKIYKFKLLITPIFVLFIILSFFTLNIEAVDNMTAIKVVRELNRYNLENNQEKEMRNKIMNVLSYGFSEDIIINLLENEDYSYSKVKEIINQLNKGVELKLSIKEMEKEYNKDNLPNYIYNMRKKAANERTYLIKYYANSDKNTKESPSAYQVWMPIPQKWYDNSTVNLKMLSISPEPDKTYGDEHGNKIAYWSSSTPSKEYSIEFKIKIKKNNHNITPKDYKFSYNKNSGIFKKYTTSSPMIQADNNKITDLTNEINNDVEDPYKRVENIVDWINDNLNYKDGERDAINTINNGGSDCAGFASVFTALARNAGIPSRLISIFHPLDSNEFKSGKLFDTLGAHIIAEFYLQDYGWVEVDPGSRNMIGNIPYFYIVMTRGSIKSLKNMEYNLEQEFFHLAQSNFQNLEPQTGLKVEKIDDF